MYSFVQLLYANKIFKKKAKMQDICGMLLREG
jgi:hypothetical protein